MTMTRQDMKFSAINNQINNLMKLLDEMHEKLDVLTEEIHSIKNTVEDIPVYRTGIAGSEQLSLRRGK